MNTVFLEEIGTVHQFPSNLFRVKTVNSIESIKLDSTNYLGSGNEELCRNWTKFDYYECDRIFIKYAIHSPVFAKRYCKNLDNFGNCTIPQVRNTNYIYQQAMNSSQ